MPGKEVPISDLAIEPILEPELPIVDSHHHLWFLPEAMLVSMEASGSVAARALAPMYRRYARYLFDEFMSDVGTGHNIRASVFVDAHAMYRSNGPEALRSVGEVEFVTGVAAMSASGLFGDFRACAGIVGGVDLRVGHAVDDVLAAHIRAGGGRYRGVRCASAYDEDVSILGTFGAQPRLLLDAKFRSGFSRLSRVGLSFDAWLLEPQLPELIDLACAFPDTQIILNHVGAPVGVGRYVGRRAERFPLWLDRMQALARCPNVAVKLGGLGIPFGGFGSFAASPPFSSAALAQEWRPYIETCIETFGVHRCMFESNFPVDSAVCGYAVLWNAFKRIVSGASEEEKRALFSGTAIRLYRLDL